MLKINDNTKNPLSVASGLSITAFSADTVTDTAPLGNTETVTVTLSAPQYSYPPVSNLGTLTDPDGGGTFNAATFTESGLDTGSPTFATNLLQRLTYKAPSLSAGQSAVVLATVSVNDGDGNTIADSPVAIDVVTPPLISGTVSNQPVASGGTIRPFATASITDNSFGGYYINGQYIGSAGVTDAATITIMDGSHATDADGLLTGSGLSKTGVGTYLLTGSNYNIGYELSSLQFATTALAPGQTANPTFDLNVTDTRANLSSSDSTTSVLTIGPAAIAPIIAGTAAGQTVTAGNTINPFGSATISDTNGTPTDSATITLTNASGNATDANGTLSGNGLTEAAKGSGIYTLTATDPKTLTTELDALTFTPAALPTGVSSVTTGFTLAVSDPVFPTPATDTKTTVTETVPQQPIGGSPGSGPFYVQNETTGTTYFSTGEAYTGPVQGLTNEIILVTSDTVNITSEVASTFIQIGLQGSQNPLIAGVNMAGNGNNVLDSYANSSFLTDGSGTDQDYLDTRDLTQNQWDTVVNFHSGDNITMWGVTPQDFTLNWIGDTQGAGGYTGLTGVFTPASGPIAAITLAGFKLADQSDGKLSVSYNSIGGTPYASIHAN